MLTQETHVDPQGAAAVVAVGDADEGREDFRVAAVVPQVHGVRAVVNVHRRPAPGARAMSFHESPLRRGRVREGLQAELVAQRHRLLVGEHLVAGPDDAHDVAGVGRDQGLSVRHRDIARFPMAGDRGENGGFLDGEKPVSAWRICVHQAPTIAGGVGQIAGVGRKILGFFRGWILNGESGMISAFGFNEQPPAYVLPS